MDSGAQRRMSEANEASSSKPDSDGFVPPIPPTLPDPSQSFDASFGLDHSIVEDLDPETKHKIEKRASNVMRLAEENEKLEEQLRAMTARLEAAERRSKMLQDREDARGGDKTG